MTDLIGAGALLGSTLKLFNELGDCQTKQWISDHLDYQNADWCLIWPFARKGGGYAQFSRSSILVHRLMCEYRNGPPPSPSHHAAHSCERGHDGCVNPNHLSWKTPSENQLDRYRDADLQPSRKLTYDQVISIRALKGLEPSDITAARFNVHESNIRLIQAGKTWKNPPKNVLSEEQVNQVRTKPYVKTASQWAQELGVNIKVIRSVRQFATYKYYKAPNAADRASQLQTKGE